MPHEDEARERMLKSVYTHQVLMLGVARDSVDDEENDADYRRASVTLGEPQTGDDGRIFVASTEDVQMQPYANDADKPLKFWMLYDVSGKMMAYDRITRVGADEPRPLLPAAGEAPLFPAGAIRVGLR